MSWIKELILRVDRHYNAIDRAKAAGTYNALDRSRQYEQISNAELVRAVNEAWTRVRSNERAIHAKEQDITALREKVKRYRWLNAILISIFTALAWEGTKALVTYLAYR